MIQLKSAREIEAMAEGGRILATALDVVAERALPGVSTAELDEIAEEVIRSHAGAEPAFKGLYGFPCALCTSINDEIVHGIPSRTRVLRAGDLLSIDLGVRFQGLFTDAARTVPIGAVDATSQRLLEVTERALEVGIAAARLGNHVGDIGAAVQAVVEQAGFTVVRDLVGHGIGTDPHEEPQVPNYGKPKRGTKLVPGLVIAIEPMVNVGSPKTRTRRDGWTIATWDGERSAHFEHTVAITDEGPRILTHPGTVGAGVAA
ncbi:MAG TPA: type I methionyl aminopeptidase [Gemmatimonadaceae bacterium]|nr:type I methionyl aminopeptidase [Gemmatimonadaceae bacterium]